MNTFRAFFDKDYQFLKLLHMTDRSIPEYSLRSEVVFWEDITEQTERLAEKRAKKIAADYKKPA